MTKPPAAGPFGLPHLALLVLLAGVYFLAGKLGLMLAIVHPNASAVWAPTGIALATLLLLGERMWPAIFVGAFLVNVTTAGSALTSVGVAAGNTLEAVIGAALVNRFANGRNTFDSAPDIFRFTILAAMIATMASPTLGVTSLALGGYARWADFVPIWLTWWLGDMGGALVITPLLLLWIRDPRVYWTRAEAFEAGLLLLTLVAVGAAVFGRSSPFQISGHPLAFLCMPVLVWAAFRFDPRIASTAIVVLSGIAVTGTLRGTLPAERWAINESLVLLQVFMGVAAVTTLVLATMVAERRRVERTVWATSEDLRRALAELEAFSHSISHDLRSPVGAVLNYSAVIEEDFGGRLDEDARRLLHRMRASAESAATLLDQLVQYGSAERLKGERRPIDMTALARDVHGEIVAGGDEAELVQFELPELPPALGSAALVRCVLRNLFNNGVKYTRGRPQRRIVMDSVAGARENVYSVTDNGIGFDPGLGHAVFQPHRRLRSAAGIEGSGLGLAIAARIIRDHRGRIWAESDGASGARFYFTLPSGVRNGVTS